jgi:phosphonoacetaldehyde hydrolase
MWCETGFKEKEMAPFVRREAYTGPVQGVILDWAGTAVDFGSMGPVAVIRESFRLFDIDISVADVRQFMGLMKKDHIRYICRLPAVSARWREKYGQLPDEIDIEALYAETEPMMVSSIAQHAEPIPGLIETVEKLRKSGIRIGSTTGYTRPMMEKLVPVALQKGYQPDAVVCPSDVPAGRPYPWMCFQNAIQLQVYPLEAMVKIGDTISDIEEGLNAGMWTIGLTKSGNSLGLPLDEADRLTSERLKERLSEIETSMREAGAHYVTEGIWSCMPIIAVINDRLHRGEQPLKAH